MVSVYSGLVLLIRGHLRWGIFGIDDFLAAIATLLQAGEVTAILLALRFGVGTSFKLLTTEQVRRASSATFTGNVLFILSTGAAKCSVIFLMMRLFNLIGKRANRDAKSRIYRILCLCAIGFVCIWTVGAIIGLSVDCSPSELIYPATSAQKCPGQVTRWEVIMAFDVVTELLLVILAITIILPLQLTVSMKIPVVMAFAFRLPCAALSILHFHYVGNYVHSNPDGLRVIPVLNIMQVQLCWSLVSATIPNLKAFIRSFNSGFGLGLDIDAAYGTSGGYGGRTDYELSQLGKSAQRSHNRSYAEPEREEGRPVKQDLSKNSDTSRDQHFSFHEQEGSVTSVGSQDQIIRKDVQWHITYEDDHAR